MDGYDVIEINRCDLIQFNSNFGKSGFWLTNMNKKKYHFFKIIIIIIYLKII